MADTRNETISANVVGLYVTRETVPGVIPENAVWQEREPNEFGDFGPSLNKVSRAPINGGRRRKKSTVVGQSVTAGYTTDVTATNIREDMEAFMFAAAKHKGRIPVASFAADGPVLAPVDGGPTGTSYKAGDLVAVTGSSVLTNNGVRIMAGAGQANKLALAGIQASGDGGYVSRCGIQFTAGAVSIDASGALPVLVGAGFLALGLIPGEIVYLGGDGAAFNFAEEANRGWCRVFAVSDVGITFDKTDAPFVEDEGAAKTVRLYFGSTLRDEDTALQRTFTHSIRRTLGAKDRDAPGVIQSEVVTKAVANTLTLSIPEEDKLTAEMEYIAGDYKTFANDSVIGGTILEAPEDDAINSTRDAVRASMIVYDGTSSPTPIFAVFQELELEINNNLSENKAITRFGAFNVSPGVFEVNGSFTGYFVGLDATEAVRDNADVSFLFCAWKNNAGIAYDLPMLSLSTDGMDVEPNAPITIEIDGEAGTGKKYNRAMDHTLMVCFYDYLPTNARV